MTTIVLLSGAGLPAWIWDEVRAALPATVVAPRPDGRDATLTDHARAALDAAPEGPLTLVGHSAGAVVAARIAELAPERVAAMVAVAGVVPTPGGSFVSAMPPPQRLLLSIVLRVVGTRPPESVIRSGVAAGLATPVADRLVADLVPESRAYFTDRVGPGPRVPVTGYLSTTADAELSASLQARFADRLGPGFRRALPGGHLPMLECPSALIDTLGEVVAETGSGPAQLS